MLCQQRVLHNLGDRLVDSIVLVSTMRVLPSCCLYYRSSLALGLHAVGCACRVTCYVDRYLVWVESEKGLA